MLICFEGAIGVGKSHFLKTIKNNIRKVFVAEETIPELEPLIEANYTNPVRYGNMFQVSMLQRKEIATRHAMASSKEVKVIERCIDSNYEVFAKNAHSKGFMSDMDLFLYEKTYSLMVKNLKKPDVYVYLDCPPEFAYQRIQSRGRKGEKYYPIEYFIDVLNSYKAWINTLKEQKKRVHEVWFDRDFSDQELINIFSEIVSNESGVIKKKKRVERIYQKE